MGGRNRSGMKSSGDGKRSARRWMVWDTSQTCFCAVRFCTVVMGGGAREFNLPLHPLLGMIPPVWWLVHGMKVNWGRKRTL